MPIGFTKRQRLGLQNVGLNCAVCHTGTVRETPESKPRIVLGMPAHQLDLQGLFRFVLDCALDDKLTADSVLGTAEKLGGDVGLVEKMLYRTLGISQVKLTVLSLQRSIAPLLASQVPDWGRGRVDTFNPYKAIQFGWALEKLPPDEIIGASDFPSLWNQKPRAEPLPQAPEGMHLHWDGNNNSVDERNLSASLGAGVTPTTIDHDRLQRVRDWIWTLEVPRYPYRIDEELAAQGEVLYREYIDPTSGETCLNCHADHRFREGIVAGTRVGTVVPIEQIDTDPHRLIWGALCNVYPEAEEQRCWNHRIINILAKVPKREQPPALLILRQIPYAESRQEAERLKRVFQEWCRSRGLAPAADLLDQNWDRNG